MQLREITTDDDRQIFGKRLAEARRTRGAKFRETPRSRLGQLHITLGSLYALFENEDDPADRMLGGFATHDLATFPQSYPKPDLSHLPPQSVLEGGELWSLSTGIGRIARAVAAAVAGARKAQAIILYPIFKPVNLSTAYAQLGFVPTCGPIGWPFAESIDGGEILVQPMILEGAGLDGYVRSGLDFLSAEAAAGRALSFDTAFMPRSSGSALLQSLADTTTVSDYIAHIG